MGLADEARAAYENPDGSFAAEKFEADLAAGRRTILTGYAIFPGSLNALSLYLFFRCAGSAATAGPLAAAT